MKSKQLEVGRIINTHGVRGELKVDSWLDDPSIFQMIEKITVNGEIYNIVSARVQGKFALIKLEGIDSIDDALHLKSKVALADREYIPLEEGGHFLADLVGLEAINADNGEVFGKVTDILEYPAQDVYEIKGTRDYLIPDVPEFVECIDESNNCIRFHLIEGL